MPKAFHGPTVEAGLETRLSASLERELEEELLGRQDLEGLVEGSFRQADPFHRDRLSEPMRWLLDRRHTDAFRVECVGFGINMVSGNFEFPCLILIDDEEWWARYGGQVEANWEMERIRRYSSRDAAGLQALIIDPRWSNEGLFAFLEGLRRLATLGRVSRLDLPTIETRRDGDNWYMGNAVADSTDNHGWLLGHFLAGSNGVRATDAIEVKWGIHPAGDSRDSWQTDEQRTTILLLVKGRFRLELSAETFVLEREGDYAVWGPGIDHSWHAEEDSVVITVRWPSLPV